LNLHVISLQYSGYPLAKRAMAPKVVVDASAVAAGVVCYALYLAFVRTCEWLTHRSKKVVDAEGVELTFPLPPPPSEEPGPEPGPGPEPSPEPQPQPTEEYPQDRWASPRAIKFIALFGFVVALAVAGLVAVDTHRQLVTPKGGDAGPEQGSATPAVSINLSRQRMAQTLGNGKLYFKSAYYGTLSLGTPAVPYTFVFDTGSGHLVVPSAYCKSRACTTHKRYRRGKSTSAHDIDYDGTEVLPGQPRDTITVEFGTGQIQGVFVEDVMCLDDASLNILRNVTKGAVLEDSSQLPPGCVKLRIIAATEMSDEPFDNFAFDGILGLGLESLSQAPEFNFMGVMAGQLGKWGGGAPSTFGVFLGEDDNEQSQLSLGGWNAEHLADGDVFWSDVHRPELGHWLVEIKSLRVDGEIVDFCNEGCKAVVDTGTALMSVPPKIFPELYERLRHPAALDGECRGVGPQLQFELEHITLSVGPEHYARPTSIRNSTQRFGKSAEDIEEERIFGPTRSDMFCKPTLMAMDMPEPVGPKLFILGEPMLRKYYTVYDIEAKRIGFGLAHHRRPAAQTHTQSDDDADDSWWYDEAEE